MMIAKARWVGLAAVLLGSCLEPLGDDFDEDALLPRATLELRDTIVVGGRPYGAAMAGATALVSQLDVDSLVKFSLPSTTASSIHVGGIPTGVALNGTGTMALVANQSPGSVGLVNVVSGVQIAEEDAGTSVFRAIVARNGSRGYATTSTGVIYAVAMSTGALVDTGTTVPAANGVALIGDTLLIVTSMNGHIAWVDARTLTETKRISSTSSVYQDVVVRPQVDRMYLAIENRSIIEIRAISSGALVDSVVLEQPTFGLSRRPGSAELWAAHPATFFGPTGALSVIDLVSRTVTRTIPLDDPRRIAFDARGTMGIVSDQIGTVYFLR